MSMDMYMKGMSYRNIADSIKQFFGLEVTHVTIMNWVNTYMKKVNTYVNTLQPKVSDTCTPTNNSLKPKVNKNMSGMS